MDPVNVYYEEMVPIIRQAIHKYTSRFGGRIEDYLGEAWIWYRYAVNTWEPEKSPLGKRVRDIVYHRLIRKWEAERKGVKYQNLDPDKLAEVSLDWRESPEMMSEELSDDAKAILSLVEDFKEIKPTRRRLIRLLMELGCTGARIMECFEEIRESLT